MLISVIVNIIIFAIPYHFFTKFETYQSNLLNIMIKHDRVFQKKSFYIPTFVIYSPNELSKYKSNSHLNIFQRGRIGIKSSLIQLPIQLTAVLEFLAALSHLVCYVPVPLVLVSRVLDYGLRDSGRRDDAKNVARVDELYETLEEFDANAHVFRLKLKIVWRSASRLKVIY